MENDKLIHQIASLLEALGPFSKGAPREAKWLTTEQLANRLWQTDAHLHLGGLEELLRRYEAGYRERLEKGLEPDALIRRAVYPDRTTALPLWGATRHHGQPWLNQPGDQRRDPPEDIPEARRLPEYAPCIFLSHTCFDRILATQVAEALAGMHIATWMFETNVGYGQEIASGVRNAISECACCFALVTRASVASLWVLTELLERYRRQTLDFLATLPLYLDHFTQTAFAFPTLPQRWSGPLKLSAFAEARGLANPNV